MLNPVPNSAAFKLLLTLALVSALAGAACRSSSGGGDNDSAGIVVVSAPGDGVVKRVLVSEGARVAQGAGVVEIALPAAAPAPQATAESPQQRAARNYQSANTEIEAARAEVVRHEAEVQRLTPLVSAGQASQGELDGERALYERAQQRLQRAQTSARDAQTGLVVAQQPGASRQANAQPAPRETLVTAKTSSAGVVAVISVRPGDRVTQGQPVATLRSDGNDE
jgi:multidrug efflux pump subunit AcrA (membrane-fusion protein)